MRKRFHLNTADFRLPILSLLFAVDVSVAAVLPIQPEPLPSVILKLQQAADRQRADLCSYSVDPSLYGSESTSELQCGDGCASGVQARFGKTL